MKKIKSVAVILTLMSLTAIVLWFVFSGVVLIEWLNASDMRWLVQKGGSFFAQVIYNAKDIVIMSIVAFASSLVLSIVNLKMVLRFIKNERK